jgi:endonuclease YncB( thermonuclease family)
MEAAVGVLVAPYTYGARIVRCRDVDTVLVDVDRGEQLWTLARVFRLYGCNGLDPEDTAVGAEWAAAQLAAALPPGRFVLVSSLKPGKDIGPDRYGGRWVAKITTEGGDLTELLIAAGLAVKWNGRGKKPKPAWPVPAGLPRLADLVNG